MRLLKICWLPLNDCDVVVSEVRGRRRMFCELCELCDYEGYIRGREMECRDDNGAGVDVTEQVVVCI